MEVPSLISIIMPIYMVEGYLPKCIESILKQTYSTFELLLIDDGSPDRCGQICDEYALQDARIKVFHKENGGVSEARNYGLDNAKGNYVAFVDSDDWFESDMLETLYNLLNTYNVDMSACGLQKEDEDGNILLQIRENDIEVRDQIKTVITLFKGDKHYRCLAWPVGKLYKREIIEKKHIRFVKDIHYGEDRLFNFEYMKHCSVTVFSSLPKYHYLIRKNSAMMLSIIMPITISIKHSYRLLKRCFNILVRTILSVFNKQQHLIMLWMWLISILSSEMLYINLE